MCVWTEIIPSRSFNSHGVFSCKNVFIRYTIYNIQYTYIQNRRCLILLRNLYCFSKEIGLCSPFSLPFPFPFSYTESSVTYPVCMCMLFSSLGIIFFYSLTPNIGLRNNRNIRAMATIHSRLQVHHTTVMRVLVSVSVCACRILAPGNNNQDDTDTDINVDDSHKCARTHARKSHTEQSTQNTSLSWQTIF